MTTPADDDALARENALLRARLEEAEDTLRALGQGEVDALVVGEDIYTLEGAEATANRFRSDVLAQMEDAVVATDVAGHVIYLNPAAERQYGMLASQALGRPLAQLYEPVWLEPADQAVAEQALERDGLWRGRNLHRSRSGATLLMENTQSRLRDAAGQVTGALVVARDVSDKAAAEAALRESRARLHFALESARIGDWELDLDNHGSRRSLRHDQCFGYTAPVAEWSLAIFMLHVHVDDRAMVQEALAGAMAGDDVHFECRVIWPDASAHWIEVHATLQADAGQPRRLVGIVSDITTRKAAETALHEADARKDVFLATLAHELRNPLAPIRNAVRIMRLSRDPDVHERYLATVEHQIEHLVHLLDDLMDVGRISRGMMELRRQPIAIADVLRAAVDSARPKIERKRQTLALQLPPQPVLLDADLTRLTQVFANLLDNAAKYTPDCGHIVLSAVQEGSMLVIQVRDSGVGIHPAMLPHVFDMFTQVRRGNAQQGGMGIGLALVKRLVDMHGGTVVARSAGVGLGSTLEVRLPATPVPLAGAAAVASPPPAAPPQPMPAPAGGARRVLVAEDNIDSAESMALLLQLMGHTVAVVHDGVEAVARAQSFQPQVVLMDIGLPGCDGYEAARRIRAQPWGQHMLLVALTGWGQETDRERSRAAGLDHHLVKPVDPTRLEELLSTARQA